MFEYSVPTNDHVLVPETLLKKRKSQEKARAERASVVEKRKAVCITSSPSNVFMMHNIPSTRHSVSMSLIVNLLSGLIFVLEYSWQCYSFLHEAHR